MADKPPKKGAAKKEAAAKKAAEAEARRRARKAEKEKVDVSFRFGERKSDSSVSEAATESLLLTPETYDPEASAFREEIPESGKESPVKPGEASGSKPKLQGREELEETSLKKLSSVSKQMPAVSTRSAGKATSKGSRRSELPDVKITLVETEFVREADADKSKSRGKTGGAKQKGTSMKQTAVSSEEPPPASDPGTPGKSSKGAKKGKKSRFSPLKDAVKGLLRISPGKDKSDAATTSKASEGQSLEMEKLKESESLEGQSPRKYETRQTKKSPGEEAATEEIESSSLLLDPEEETERSPLMGKSKSPREAVASLHPGQPSSRRSSSSSSLQSLISVASELMKDVKRAVSPGKERPSDEIPLIDEPMVISDSENTGETPAVEESHAGVQEQVGSSTEEGGMIYQMARKVGFGKDTVRRDTIGSSVDELPTDTSMLSDSSSIQGSGELIEISTSSSGTQSRTFSLEAEEGVASGSRDEQASRKPVQGQKRVNVESQDSDEESRAFAAIASPSKKAPPPEREAEDSDKK